MGKKLSKGAKIALAGAAGAGLFYFAAGAGFYEAFLTSKAVHKKNKPHLPPEAEKERCRALEKHENASEWYAAQDDNDLELISLRGETIRARYIPAEVNRHKYLICIHGYTSSPYRMAGPAYEFYKRGFNVLMPYLGGHGLSDRKTVSMGYHDRLDIVDWINYLVTFDEDAEIVLYGVSMGAATTLMTTGEDLPDNVKCAISDCGFTTAWEEFMVQCKNVVHLPPFPFLYALRRYAIIRDGFDPRKCSPLDCVQRSKTPTLFIHGDKDEFVPFWMLDVLYDNAVCEKERLVVEGAVHANSDEVNPELYWKTVFSFVDKYLTPAMAEESVA